MFTTCLMKKGKRKTQDPCPGCFLHQTRCLCDQIPYFDLKTKVSLIIHHRELKRTTNTGMLAIKALANSSVFVRGLVEQPLNFTEIFDPNYFPVLLYPSDGSVELNLEFLETISKPVQLLVPDGNWRQASKVSIRSQELKQVPHVRLKAVEDKHFLRKETKAHGMATLQAIAESLRVIESQEIGSALQELYQLKLTRTLQGRGDTKS